MPMDAASIMTRQIITARPDSSVADVAKLLTDYDIGAVPVCAADGALLGIISESDLMRPFREDHSLRRAWWLAILSHGDTLPQQLADYIRQDRHCASDLMTHPVITAQEDICLSDLAVLLLQHHIKRVPIVRDGRPVGIVSRADLVRALALHRDAFGETTWEPSCAGSDNPAIISPGATPDSTVQPPATAS
ncbi:MAG TPA: CBS domain-containing protein [Rhodopila sp.]|nr:CBS domain-containing protein [Rhodopila sp.]